VFLSSSGLLVDPAPSWSLPPLSSPPPFIAPPAELG
jgi:hypothetical protein